MVEHKETINIGNIAGGALPEVFDRALQDVLKNIADINCPAEQARQINIKVKFKPSASREVGEVSFICETKLASVHPAKGNFFLAKRGADVRGYARDPKQDELFIKENSASPSAQ